MQDLAELVIEARGLIVTDRVTLKLISERTGNSLGGSRCGGRVSGSKFSKGVTLAWRLNGI